MMAQPVGTPAIAFAAVMQGGNEMLHITFQGVGWGRIAGLVEQDRLVARLCHQMRATVTSEDDGCLILVMPHDGGERGH